MNNDVIMKKQEKKYNSNLFTYSQISSLLFILFPCKQIVQMIQKVHIKTATFSYSEPFAFV